MIQRYFRARSGFSLIAVIIFLGVAAVLIGVLVPMAYRDAMEARERGTRQELEDLNQALVLYYADVGEFPRDRDGFEALVTDPGVAGWRGPYLTGYHDTPLDEALNDAWGRRYVYDRNPTTLPPATGNVMVVSGGMDRKITIGRRGRIWRLDDPDADDLWTLVNTLGIDQEQNVEVTAELEKVAVAAQAYYLDRGEYPNAIADLVGDYLTGGVGGRATTDSWNNAYRLRPDNRADPPILEIVSFGPDGRNDRGGDDDLTLTINSVVPGRRATVYRLKIAQARVDADTSFGLTGNWPADRVALSLDPVLDQDGWQLDFEEKVSTREILSAGPDGDYWTPLDNIPLNAVPDDGDSGGSLQLVLGSVQTRKKTCHHIRFRVKNTSDDPVTITEVTVNWVTPEAYFNRVNFNGKRRVWQKNPRIGPNETQALSKSWTVNPGQKVRVDVRDFYEQVAGGPKQNMGDTVFSVEFNDGSIITFRSPECGG